MHKQAYLIGARLRSARERAGLSQAALARQSGKSQRSICDYELGRTRVSLDWLEQASKVLRADPKTIAFGDQ